MTIEDIWNHSGELRFTRSRSGDPGDRLVDEPVLAAVDDSA